MKKRKSLGLILALMEIIGAAVVVVSLIFCGVVSVVDLLLTSLG